MWQTDMVQMFDYCSSGIPALWPTVVNIFYQEVLLNINPWLAGLTLQTLPGFCGTLWMIAWMCVFVEHARDAPLESIVHPVTLFKAAGIASLAATVSFSGAVYQLRSDALVETDLSRQDATVMFSCTWPCVVLQAASACAFGAGSLATIFVCRLLLGGLEDARQCWRCRQNFRSVCFNLGHGLATAFLVGLFSKAIMVTHWRCQLRTWSLVQRSGCISLSRAGILYVSVRAGNVWCGQARHASVC